MSALLSPKQLDKLNIYLNNHIYWSKVYLVPTLSVLEVKWEWNKYFPNIQYLPKGTTEENKRTIKQDYSDYNVHIIQNVIY